MLLFAWVRSVAISMPISVGIGCAIAIGIGIGIGIGIDIGARVISPLSSSPLRELFLIA